MNTLFKYVCHLIRRLFQELVGSAAAIVALIWIAAWVSLSPITLILMWQEGSISFVVLFLLEVTLIAPMLLILLVLLLEHYSEWKRVSTQSHQKAPLEKFR